MTRAARLVAHGAPLRSESVDLPTPAAGEVLVDLSFAGMNPVDRYMAEGRVAPDGPLSRTLGGEASGHLDGRPVLVAGGGLGASRDGVWAEAAVVPRSAVVALPDGIDLKAAAALGVAGLTAWKVVDLGGVGADDRVLVLGASGGVGLPIVSLAASRGATVWGQTGDEQKTDAVRAQGAAQVVVCDADGLAGAVGDYEPTVVIDPLGDGFTRAALGCLAVGGRHVIFGTSAGAAIDLDLQQLYRSSRRLLGYGGFQLGEGERREGLRETIAAFADGRLRIVVDRTFPLADVTAAMEAMGDRSTVGKIILEL
jgi:NADPH2:quinone reductase